MRIATSNLIVSSSPTVDVGTILGGDANSFVRNSNFSDRLVIQPNGSGLVTITIPNSTTLDYFWLAGINVQTDASYVIEVTCGSYNKVLAPVEPNIALWFDMSVERPQSDIVIEFFTLGTKNLSLSLGMAGISSEIPNGGVAGGQQLPVYKYNKKTLNAVDSFGNPTSQITRSERPNISWNFPNITYATSSNFLNIVRDFYDLIEAFGVAPSYDNVRASVSASFNGVRESYGVFAISSDSFAYDPRTNKLVTWTLRAKACF
jgi:hypothetical protein